MLEVGRVLAVVAKDYGVFLTLIGVLVGAFVGARFARGNDFTKWGREQRLSAYVEFLSVVQELHSLKVDYGIWRKGLEGTNRHFVAAGYETKEEELIGRLRLGFASSSDAISKIRLIATSPVLESAIKLRDLALDSLERKKLDRDMSVEEQDAFYSRLSMLRDEFVKCARVELGFR